MKRTFVDIRKIASYNALYNGYQHCCEGDKGKRKDAIEYSENLSENLKKLSRRLLNETWEPDKGRSFKIFTEGKWRIIHIVGIEDRIVHQSLVYHFGLQKKFIKRTFGSIKKRGTLAASKQVRRDIHREKRPYVIKLDVHKYYPSVNKKILKEQIRRKYKGERALRLYEKIIDSYLTDEENGISIGALTSQNNGNFYLSDFDYYCLQELKVHCLSRYIDDIVIQCKSKEQAAIWIPKMKKFIAKLGLEFGRIELFPLSSRRIDFCSYAVNDKTIRLRKKILKHFVRKLRDLQKKPCDGMYERNSICSYLGFMKYCNSYNLLKQLKNEYSEIFSRINRYAKGRRSKENEVARSSTRNRRVQTLFQPSHQRSGRHRRNQRRACCYSNSLC